MKKQIEKQLEELLKLAEDNNIKIVAPIDEEGNGFNIIYDLYTGTNDNIICFGVGEGIDEEDIFNEED